MKIKKETLVGIYLALGFKTASKWEDTKLGSPEQLAKIAGQVDEDTVLDDTLDPPLRKLLAALEAEDPIELFAPAPVAAEEAEAEAPKAAPKKKAAKAAPPADDDDEKPAPAPKKAAAAKAPVADDAGDDEVVEKPKPAKEAKPAKAAKKATPAEPKPPKEPRVRKGVTKARARPYLAGILLKEKLTKAGLTLKDIEKIGIDDKDVTRLNACYGKANDNESLFSLRNAWHAIRGFITKDNESELVVGAPADEAE